MFPYLPQEDAISAPYWSATRQHKLLLQYCATCNKYQWYPRALCILCGTMDLDWRQASGSGTLDSWTQVLRSPSEGFVPPYVIARVLLSENVMMLTRLDGVESPTCDQPVELFWQDLSDGRALPVFR